MADQVLGESCEAFMNYHSIRHEIVTELEIKKSRFITWVSPICSQAEAEQIIAASRQRWPGATHYCFAWITKDPVMERCSDDGEPSGTAGIPVLEVIKKENLRNVAVVVTRYFGGIKLGAGGLIRAYTKGAKIGLDAGTIVDMVLHTRLKIRIDYTLYGKIENYLMNEEYIVDESVFDDAVNIFVYIEDGKKNDFYNIITDLTNGSAIIEELDEEYIAIKDGKRFI